MRLVLLLALLVAATARAQSPDAAIRRADSAWARSYAQHDTATALQLFDDRLIVTSSSGALKDRNGELGDVRPADGMQMHFFRTNDVQVRVAGSTAVAAGLAEWSFTWNGRTSTIRRRYTATYAQGGALGWRMVALHIGPAPEAR